MSKLFIEETTLTAIGDAIREKTGLEDLIAPGDMPNEIRSIETGGADPIIEAIEITANGTYNTYEGIDGFAPITVKVPQDGAPTAEDFAYTGGVAYAFCNDNATNLINKYGYLYNTKDLIDMTQLFYSSKRLTKIPFDLNCATYTTQTLNNIFAYCENLTELPRIINAKPGNFNSMFNHCDRLRVIPSDYCDTWDWSAVTQATSAYNGTNNGMFSNCYSLRSYPNDLLENTNPLINSTYNAVYYQTFYGCYSLDQVIDFPVAHKTKATTNFFYDTIKYCYRLKELMFKPNESASWKNQTIDFTNGVGYIMSNASSVVTSYNSGITADKEVKDEATYEALKNDPDWFSANIRYSRYNHDSAVNTINSLPDVTSGSGNVIKFRGNCGSATDGGAINTLTEEEIAVAAAKGWTVTLV